VPTGGLGANAYFSAAMVPPPRTTRTVGHVVIWRHPDLGTPVGVDEPGKPNGRADAQRIGNSAGLFESSTATQAVTNLPSQVQSGTPPLHAYGRSRPDAYRPVPRPAMNNSVSTRRLQCLPDRASQSSGRDRPLHPPEVSRLDGAMHYDVGIAYEALELPDDAIYEFELAADDPTWAFPSWRSVGRLHHARLRWDEALRAYERALDFIDATEPSALRVQEELALAQEHTPLPGTVESRPAMPENDDPTPENDDPMSNERDVDQAFDDLFS